MNFKNIFIKYNKVQIETDKNPVFPDYCVICGEKSPGEKHEFSGNQGGLHGAWKRIYATQAKIKIPAHQGCKENLQKKEKIHMMYITIAWLVLAGCFLITNRSIFSLEYVAGFFIILVSYNVIVAKFLSPIPFLFICYNDSITFYFTNKKYFERFLNSNSSSIIKVTGWK